MNENQVVWTSTIVYDNKLFSVHLIRNFCYTFFLETVKTWYDNANISIYAMSKKSPFHVKEKNSLSGICKPSLAQNPSFSSPTLPSDHSNVPLDKRVKPVKKHMNRFKKKVTVVIVLNTRFI